MIRLGYPTQNLTMPASTNRSLRLASLGDAEKVRALDGREVDVMEEGKELAPLGIG